MIATAVLLLAIFNFDGHEVFGIIGEMKAVDGRTAFEECVYIANISPTPKGAIGLACVENVIHDENDKPIQSVTK